MIIAAVNAVPNLTYSFPILLELIWYLYCSYCVQPSGHEFSVNAFCKFLVIFLPDFNMY